MRQVWEENLITIVSTNISPSTNPKIYSIATMEHTGHYRR